jgi:hypothetical protein
LPASAADRGQSACSGLRSFVADQVFSHSRDLQIYGANAVGDGVATGLSNHIFKNFYKDALLSLSQKQRISYQLIHSLVDSANLGINEFRDLTMKLHDEYLANRLSKKFTKTSKVWGEKAKNEFKNCAALRWQIQFHLTQSQNPDLSPFAKHHEEYLRYLEGIELEVKALIKSGESIPLENFRKIYNPVDFQRRPSS